MGGKIIFCVTRKHYPRLLRAGEAVISARAGQRTAALPWESREERIPPKLKTRSSTASSNCRVTTVRPIAVAGDFVSEKEK